jgi:hypothetical protein
MLLLTELPWSLIGRGIHSFFSITTACQVIRPVINDHQEILKKYCYHTWQLYNSSLRNWCLYHKELTIQAIHVIQAIQV